ncbi:MAG: hypothetical protein K8J09_00880 [Planctomycetes bacterium]|nr:hypothetical protein [Planctomycetota bacterium]MCC7397749.1 hypothetical protein [Planctomycetota bacterium]
MMHPDDLRRDLLANAPLRRDTAPFTWLEVRGRDAAEFVHRLCAQDVLGMSDGQLRPAAWLDAKGKLVATCLLVRFGDRVLLEVMAEQAERLHTLLQRYHFTEQLTIVPPRPVGCVETVFAATGEATVSTAALVGEDLRLRCTRRGITCERQHGAVLVGNTPARPLDAATAECLRLLAGFVRVGVETEPSTLALEVDLDDHLSTTKGCYTGQEIVARIHTYGHTNRKACLLWLPAGAPITAPVPLIDADGDAVGRVLHAVPVPGHAARLGLGYLPKDFQAIGTQLGIDGGRAVVIGYEPLAGLPA